MELNKIKSKYNAITLVELIISLTMVSILMLMVFGVIFKKTKASIMSPAGTFYCWKDWSGKLHQRCYTSGGNGICEGFQADGNGDECKLDFTKVLPKGYANIRAYLIGGGAAGASYEINESNPIKYACDINRDGCQYIPDFHVKVISEINKGLSCFASNTNTNNICALIESSSGDDSPDKYSFNDDIDGQDNITPKGPKPALGKCKVKLKSNNKINTFIVDYPSGDNNYIYYDGGNSSMDCGPLYSPSGKPAYPDTPFLILNEYERLNEDGRIEIIIPADPPINAIREKIEYKVAYQPNYAHYTPKAVNRFISVSPKLDINSPLIIKKDDIGNPGKFGSYSGAGGGTILRSNIDQSIIAKADGMERQKNTSSKFNLDIDIKNYNKTQDFRFCCSGDAVNNACKFEFQNTGLQDYIQLNSIDIPKIEYSCGNTSFKSQKPDYTDVNGNVSDGFGLFGYNGASGDGNIKYCPYSTLRIEKDGPDLGKFCNPDYNTRKPGNGMGGAIIIQWN